MEAAISIVSEKTEKESQAVVEYKLQYVVAKVTSVEEYKLQVKIIWEAVGTRQAKFHRCR